MIWILNVIYMSRKLKKGQVLERHQDELNIIWGCNIYVRIASPYTPCCTNTDKCGRYKVEYNTAQSVRRLLCWGSEAELLVLAGFNSPLRSDSTDRFSVLPRLLLHSYRTMWSQSVKLQWIPACIIDCGRGGKLLLLAGRMGLFWSEIPHQI